MTLVRFIPTAARSEPGSEPQAEETVRRASPPTGQVPSRKVDVMVRKTMKHAQLDVILDRLAQNPDTFELEGRKLAAELEKSGSDLEITNPETWQRGPLLPREHNRISIENQLRNEVDNRIQLDRESEARLARRVEFARY